MEELPHYILSSSTNIGDITKGERVNSFSVCRAIELHHGLVFTDKAGNRYPYIPERTCTRGSRFWECSECGREALVSAFNYCPDCGARVVGD